MWPFNKKETPEQKTSIREIDISNDESMNNPATILLGLSSGEPIHISPLEAYYLSERNSDLGTAVSMISGSISSLKFLIKDSSGETRNSDPILDLLNNPGEGTRKIQFMYEIAESFSLTNEAWIVGRGNIANPPLSLVNIRPYNISITIDKTDGLPSLIQTECDKDRRTYTKQLIKGEIRYIDKIGFNEIFPVIGATSLSDEWRGRSRLAKLFYDVGMNTDGKRHNLSILKNGMRATGIMTPSGNTSGGAQETWGPDAVKSLEENTRAFYQGAGNAGNIMILSRQAQFLDLMKNNRDMDFLSLLGVTKEAIYNNYKIPLPLILSDAMTLSNYSVAQRSYYDNAVIPVYDDIADGIIKALSTRFNSIEDSDVLTFSEVDVNALRTSLIEDMEMLNKTEAVSTNEARSVGGYEPRDEAESILVSSNKVPLEFLDPGPTFEDLSDD